jgi:hypothetical protein
LPYSQHITNMGQNVLYNKRPRCRFFIRLRAFFLSRSSAPRPAVNFSLRTGRVRLMCILYFENALIMSLAVVSFSTLRTHFINKKQQFKPLVIGPIGRTSKLSPIWKSSPSVTFKKANGMRCNVSVSKRHGWQCGKMGAIKSARSACINPSQHGPAH